MESFEYKGTVSSVRGSVVDAVFDGAAPPMRSVLRAGPKGSIIIEVADHTRQGEIRAIALTPTSGLARGDIVVGDGSPLTAPVGDTLTGRVFNVFGTVSDGGEEPQGVVYKSIHGKPIELAERVTNEEVFETGIKVLDLLAPWKKAGRRDCSAVQVSAKPCLSPNSSTTWSAHFRACPSSAVSASGAVKARNSTAR